MCNIMKNVKEIDRPLSTVESAPTFGEYAYSIIQTQYQSMVKRERKVINDENPEHLHQMRVATRRLRTALQVFDRVVTLPKAASEKRVGVLARTLGSLRDLDVQITDLQTQYRPQLQGEEQHLLDGVIQKLKKQRRQVYTTVAETLKRSRYQDLKAAYETWLEQPKFTPFAALPIHTLLPDLLSPLLSELLLHEGWMVEADDTSTHANHTLHELRKAFKHVRYQTEFFAPLYGKSFQSWIADVKQVQEKLGKLQDSHVLEDLLKAHSNPSQLLTLQQSIQHTQHEVLSDWDTIRQRYLEPQFRCQLHQMLLEPVEQVSAEN